MVRAVTDEIFELVNRVNYTMYAVLPIELQASILLRGELVLLQDGSRNEDVVVRLRPDDTILIHAMILRQQESVEVVLVLLFVVLARESGRHVQIHDASPRMLH